MVLDNDIDVDNKLIIPLKVNEIQEIQETQATQKERDIVDERV
jgi:hypothetical protein